MARHFVFCGLLVALAGVRPSAACTHILPWTLEDAFRSNDLVVLAQIQDGERTAQSADYRDSGSVETVHFKVLLTWKGRVERGAEITTVTDLGPGSCGISVDREVRLLVATPATKISPGAIWVLFLQDVEGSKLYSDSQEVGGGGEADLAELFRLAQHKRHKARP